MRVEVIITAMIGVAMALLAALAIYSASNEPEIPGQIISSEAGVEYKEFMIKGMPCVYVTEGVGNDKTGGPTCDWSKWRKK